VARLAVELLRIRMGMAAIAVLAGCGQNPPPPAPTPPKVTVVTLKAQPVLLTTELPGRVAAYRVADVRPQVSGIILKREFIEGRDVKAGQQLYQIDPAPYRAAYDSAVAAAAAARALSARYKSLITGSLVSRQDYDNALAADLEARAAVETARINLIYTRVLSPISGRIGRSAVTEGALVTANQATALSTVTKLDPVYVDVTQPSNLLLRLRREADAGLLQQDPKGRTRVRLRLEDGSEFGQSGTLEFSEVTVDVNTGSVTLRALFPNPKRLLLPGMFVRELIEEGLRRNTVLVPQQAITRNLKGEAVALAVRQDGTVEQRVAQTDQAIGDQWVVTSGLAPGDRVIVEGMQSATPGSKVIAEEYQPELREQGTARERASDGRTARRAAGDGPG
jgi:membrane fusion protein, multidrug efflux system